jgi:hypothetical protein
MARETATMVMAAVPATGVAMAAVMAAADASVLAGASVADWLARG